MDAAGVGPVGGGGRRADAVAPTHPGRISIENRVLVKVAQEATAATLRVPRGDVSVVVSEARGAMAVTISTPLPVPNLDDTAAILAGTPVLERVAGLQSELRNRIAHAIGRGVTRVNITITGAVVAEQKRVK